MSTTTDTDADIDAGIIADTIADTVPKKYIHIKQYDRLILRANSCN